MGDVDGRWYMYMPPRVHWRREQIAFDERWRVLSLPGFNEVRRRWLFSLSSAWRGTGVSLVHVMLLQARLQSSGVTKSAERLVGLPNNAVRFEGGGVGSNWSCTQQLLICCGTCLAPPLLPASPLSPSPLPSSLPSSSHPPSLPTFSKLCLPCL